MIHLSPSFDRPLCAVTPPRFRTPRLQRLLSMGQEMSCCPGCHRPDNLDSEVLPPLVASKLASTPSDDSNRMNLPGSVKDNGWDGLPAWDGREEDDKLTALPSQVQSTGRGKKTVEVCRKALATPVTSVGFSVFSVKVEKTWRPASQRLVARFDNRCEFWVGVASSASIQLRHDNPGTTASNDAP